LPIVDATRRAQADPIPDTVRCGRSVPFEEEDESPFVGLFMVEAAAGKIENALDTPNVGSLPVEDR